MAVAIFSLYSVHLLLKTANEGGEAALRESQLAFGFSRSCINNKALRCPFFVCLFPGALVYEQLGYKAFGMPGKLAASCSITMQNIGGEGGGSLKLKLLGFFLLPHCLSSLWKTFPNAVVFVSPAMSSYLFIVKYELPIVIQAFLGSSSNG